MRGYKVTDEDRKEICRRYAAGEEYRAISECMGVSVISIYRIVKSVGLLGKREKKISKTQLNAQRIEAKKAERTREITECLLQGYSIDRVEKLTGHARRTVFVCYWNLVKNGTDMEKIVRDAILREYKVTPRLCDIKRKLGASGYEIRKTLYENGIKLK